MAPTLPRRGEIWTLTTSDIRMLVVSNDTWNASRRRNLELLALPVDQAPADVLASPVRPPFSRFFQEPAAGVVWRIDTSTVQLVKRDDFKESMYSLNSTSLMGQVGDDLRSMIDFSGVGASGALAPWKIVMADIGFSDGPKPVLLISSEEYLTKTGEVLVVFCKLGGDVSHLASSEVKVGGVPGSKVVCHHIETIYAEDLLLKRRLVKGAPASLTARERASVLAGVRKMLDL